MQDLGDIATVVQGEILVLLLPFGQLANGETLTGPATVGIRAWTYSPAPDANAANLLIGTIAVGATKLTIAVGGLGTAGFQCGVVYEIWAFCLTSGGNEYAVTGRLTCYAFAPPVASSGSAMPSGAIALSANATINAPGVYLVEAAGLTLTIAAPSAPALTPILIIDQFGSGASLSSSVVSWPGGGTTAALAPKGSQWLFWDSTKLLWAPA